ncbi:MAG: HAD-IIA family hydrolase [Clostridia bacterium]|nr:HAD-IIA family hydrolase [Clostridia bacterium]
MLKDVKYFIIDMDGTFYLGDNMIEGASEFTDALPAKGKDFYFFTNNSSHDAAECLAKLTKIGYPVPEEKIIISSHVAIDFIKRNRPGKKIYLLGNDNFTSDCRKAELNLVDENPDIVLLGFDTTLTYEKINKAANYIANGAEYIATHPDKNCPLAVGFMPDTGSMIEMFAASTGRYPDIIIGKPYGHTVDFVTNRLGCTRDEICFIGDRLETDIAIGVRNCTKSVLVYSGVTTPEMYEKSEIRATVAAKNLKALCDYI